MSFGVGLRDILGMTVASAFYLHEVSDANAERIISSALSGCAGDGGAADEDGSEHGDRGIFRCGRLGVNAFQARDGGERRTVAMAQRGGLAGEAEAPCWAVRVDFEDDASIS